jgi:two-component sensor histidine kinase
MSISELRVDNGLYHAARRTVAPKKHVRQQHASITAQLNDALAREKASLREKSDLLQRQDVMGQEFEYRLLNNLQLIVSLLCLQSRAAGTPEAATKLNIAADRVAALGRVHRRLHLLDHQDDLCRDLSGLLFRNGADQAGNTARLYRERADHQFGETCER